MMENLEDNLKFASKLTIALVKNNLNVDAQINPEKELKQYFNNAKKFKLNEHFCVKNILDESE